MAVSVWSRRAVGVALVVAGVAGVWSPRAAVAQDAAKRPVTVVQAPDGEDIWKGFVTGVIDAGLPALAKAAGFPYPEDTLDVSFAKDGTATRDLDAVYTGEGRLLIRKTGKRKGVRGHAILTALAHAFSERVTKDLWLQEVLAYLYTYHALGDLPQIYHNRTFLLEVLKDARKAKGVVLSKWEPGPVKGLTADADMAVAFAYMYATDRTLGDAALKGAGAAIVAKGDPVGFEEFEKALEEAAGKPVRPYFQGWYYRKKGDVAPAFKVQDLYDPDHDLLLNFEEKQAGTDPKKADTDDDGRLDGAEVFDLKSDPTSKDKRAKVPIDGNFRKWLRLKKFKSTDNKGDAKVKVAGADLVSYAITSDDTYLYLLIESDAMSNPKVVYNVAFDRDGDRVFDAIFSFRSTRQRWLVDTHGQKDLSWAEYKNDRRMSLLVRGKQAEARVPLKSLGLMKGTKVTVLVYTRAKGPDGKTRYADACAREIVDLARWTLKK